MFNIESVCLQKGLQKDIPACLTDRYCYLSVTVTCVLKIQNVYLEVRDHGVQMDRNQVLLYILLFHLMS